MEYIPASRRKRVRCSEITLPGLRLDLWVLFDDLPEATYKILSEKSTQEILSLGKRPDEASL